MPASDISRLSIAGQPRSDMASQMARDVAQREIRHRIEAGLLRVDDENSIKREWKDIYRQEYYKYYAILLQQEQPSERVIYVPTHNPAATKHFTKHSSVKFSKYNTLWIFANAYHRISEYMLNFPIEDDISLETKEAFLVDWPGPLDRPNDQHIKRKTTDYIEKVWQHDSQRRIRYCSSSSDEQRKVILRLLTEFLHRNGSLDASSITRLLLKSDLTEIQKDEGNRKPYDTLQKYMLLGKRSEAIKYAKARKLWDHAQCLAFLDKYQPPNTSNYVKDRSILKEDSIVQLNNEYINSIEPGILNTVYRSLLNRILQSDSESVHIVKHPEVGNDAYEFAMLSANDCEMDFDQSNEIFKLVNAIKKASSSPIMSNSHLISLGFTTIDTHDPLEDMSYRSNLSFKQNDTYASRTLTISNMDMLILNEIWEYCLNLARGTTDPANYDYIIDLIPFKLVFASILLDYGLNSMFAYYLTSIKHALSKLKHCPHVERDQFYDWETIERSAELLSNVWDIFLKRSGNSINHTLSDYEVSNMQDLLPVQSQQLTSDVYNAHGLATANEVNTDHLDSASHDYPLLPHQGVNVFSLNQNFPQIRAPYMGYTSVPPSFNQQPPPPPIPEETDNNFNPDPEPNMDVSPFSPPNYNQTNNAMTDKKSMTSSSPIENHRNSFGGNNPMMADSFNAFSPITDDVPRHELSRNDSEPPPLQAQQQQQQQQPQLQSQQPKNQLRQEQARQQDGIIPNRNTERSKPDDSQQPGFIANIAGSVRAFLPKSNSKQMILPDDSSKTIVFDEKRGTWIDTTKQDDEDIDDFNEPPPVAAPVRPPASYSFAPKSAKTRYPKTQFPGP